MPMINASSDKKLALVVDDSVMQCKILSVLLKEEGYQVVSANDGACGVGMYVKYKPDLVLMDINMPVMDGYTAARKIKSLSLGSLAPLIFITSLDTDQAFIESIEAGGDGILVRPFSPEVFKAKIKSIQRISDLYSEIKTLQQGQQKDAELAEQLMSGVIESRNFSLDRIKIIKQAAELFSGDIQLTALCPNGDINVLLGDFTGHGLRSSIGAIPLAETFRAMTKKGFSLYQIITQINQQLYHLLPRDLFLAAAFVTVSAHDKTIYAFNAGLPDIYLVNDKGNIKEQITSLHPPLGVVEHLLTGSALVVRSVEPEDNVVMISDGIIEARNQKGEMYDISRFETCIQKAALTNNIAEELLKEVNEFCHETLQEDDLSIIILPCGGWNDNFYQVNQQNKLEHPHDFEEKLALWSWQLSLNGERLSTVNPIPLAMNQVQELEGNGEHWQSVYTILTELFVNALDHGLLDMSSSLKGSAEGFAQYYNERQVKLNKLKTGTIDLSLLYFELGEQKKLVIRIVDSGAGFDSKQYLTDDSSQQYLFKLCGRGIELVKNLSYSLQYNEKGNAAEAVYLW